MRLLPAALLLLLSHSAGAAERPFQLQVPGTFPLDARIALPTGVKARSAERVVVLLHGSGPQDMDEDLTAVTEGKRPNHFFVDLRDALLARGFAVLRYHKRSYQVRLKLKEDPGFQGTPAFRAFAGDPLGFFLRDVEAALDLAAAKLPQARRYLIGHSQGAFLALQVARSRKDVAGAAMIGFALSGLDTLVFEQGVYRPLHLFRRLDRDRDGRLAPPELAGGDPVKASLRAQLPVLDLDGDGSIAQDEFQAGNLSNHLLKETMPAEYIRKEAELPRLTRVIRELRIPLAFFNGLWDNQTPAYNAKAVEVTAKALWKDRPFLFRYYPERGHALDPRKRYDELVYRPADPSALEDLAGSLDGFFRR